MTRFAVFAGDQYYPSGGWKDLIGRYASVEAATAAAKSAEGQWWHLVDLESGAQIDEGVLGWAAEEDAKKRLPGY